MPAPKKTALLSVYDKTGIEAFAKGLVALGFDLLASGGTAAALKKAGVRVKDVSALVGGKAILGHRVVTLSREVHAGLLATDTPEDRAELAKLNVPFIDLVCVDLYPLTEEIAKKGAAEQSVIEKTDIGGPTMLRSAAKGRRIVICDPKDRAKVLAWLRAGMPEDAAMRRALAAKAEAVVAAYALASARFTGEGAYGGTIGTRVQTLVYGENKRQGNAALFTEQGVKRDSLALHAFTLIEGGDPSFINMTDVHRLIETTTRIASGFKTNFGKVPFLGAAIKHGNCCGVAIGKTPAEVVKKMVAGDPEAISGGVILLNFKLDGPSAKLLRAHKMPRGAKRILDSVITPAFSKDAVDELVRKTGKCRMFVNPALAGNGLAKLDATRRYRQVRGGFLAQDGDAFVLILKPEWKKTLSRREQEDMILAWGIGHTANSNTIVLVKNGMLIGSGVNQRSRVMAAKVAFLYTKTYKHSTRGAIAYSDSFFPFPDGPLFLADAGIKVVFTTSGSVRDEEVFAAAKKRGVRMYTLPDALARGFYGH